MISKKPLKIFLFPAVNILIAIFLLMAFYDSGLNIVQSDTAARLNAINYLKPNPMDYIWKLNFENALLDKKKIRYYADYYEYLLHTFPSLRDIYGLLGYFYYYLGDTHKSIDYLNKGILYNPLYTWNYYNLAAVYILNGRYQEAAVLLRKFKALNPQVSVQRMVSSHFVYTPLLVGNGNEILYSLVAHLRSSYKVSFDLLQLLNQLPSNQELEKQVKNIKMELYAF